MSNTGKRRILCNLRPLLAALVAACSGGETSAEDAGTYENVMAFDTARARLAGPRDTLRLVLELAVSSEQKSTGLMERRQLADTAGMLFVYDSIQPPDAGFWMYRTRIPLDIAYTDPAGRIRAIQHMVPCESAIPQGCPTYPPGVPYQYALEVNGGFFARRRITLGDTIFLGEALRPLK